MSKLKFLTLLLICLSAECALVPELKTWDENRFVQCIHCMDYDQTHISLLGCKPKNPILCTGNTCFMRFHKGFAKPSIMYTSGCLNLTWSEMETISEAKKESEETGNSKGTLLCELAELTDTCICSNMDKCNFINLSPGFSEYNKTQILKHIFINELGHMKMFLPQEYRRLGYSSLSSPFSVNLFVVITLFCFFITRVSL